MSTTGAVNPDPDEVQGSEGINRSDGDTPTQAIQSSSRSNGGQPLASEINDGGKVGSRAVLRKATGPRTPLGKERAKQNALKHGIFSKVVFLESEPRSEFDALLRGLRRDLAPEGMLEGILVEKLVTILWRYRRLLQAQRAAQQRNIQYAYAEKARRFDDAAEFDADVERLRARLDTKGLIARIDDTSVLQSCIDRLHGVQLELQTFGLDHETHSILLARVYGARFEGRTGQDLLDCFLSCRRAGCAPPLERQKRGFSSKEDCLRQFQSELVKEIHYLEDLRNHSALDRRADETSGDELRLDEMELMECAVPEISTLDRLLRYEASLERAFDRTLNQLERTQKIRRG